MKWWFFVFICLAIQGFSECGSPIVEVPLPSPLAIKYYRSGNFLWCIDQLWSLAIPALILCTGFSAQLKRFAQRIGKNRFFTFILYAFFFFLIVTILNFPLSYYMDFFRSHEYHLSNQTFDRWIILFLKSTVLSGILGLVLLSIFYLFIRKSPKRWWLYLGLLSIPVSIILQIIQPIWIDPLFNQYHAMKDKQLEKQILTLASRAGIEDSRVFEVDKSQDTTTINAYVCGFGKTKRIVLWDTIIKVLTPNELLFVVGHEMGHYVLNHLWIAVLFNSVLTLILLFLINLVSKQLIKKHSRRFGFKELKDIASLPLILLLYTIFSFIFTPVQNLFSQCIEHEADRFGLEITHDNHAAADAFLKLTSQNLGYPRPGKLFLLFRATHPSIGSRIDFFNSYHPWCEGKPSRYEKYFKEAKK